MRFSVTVETKGGFDEPSRSTRSQIASKSLTTSSTESIRKRNRSLAGPTGIVKPSGTSSCTGGKLASERWLAGQRSGGPLCPIDPRYLAVMPGSQSSDLAQGYKQAVGRLYPWA